VGKKLHCHSYLLRIRDEVNTLISEAYVLGAFRLEALNCVIMANLNYVDYIVGRVGWMPISSSERRVKYRWAVVSLDAHESIFLPALEPRDRLCVGEAVALIQLQGIKTT